MKFINLGTEGPGQSQFLFLDSSIWNTIKTLQLYYYKARIGLTSENKVLA